MADAVPVTDADAVAAVRAAAEAYCEALWRADAETCGRIFHEATHLYGVAGDGSLVDMPRETFLGRVGGREPGTGEAEYAIHEVIVTGEMAFVRLTVAVPGRRFEDQLNFLSIGGAWRVISKVFRVAEGPAL